VGKAEKIDRIASVMVKEESGNKSCENIRKLTKKLGGVSSSGLDERNVGEVPSYLKDLSERSSQGKVDREIPVKRGRPIKCKGTSPTDGRNMTLARIREKLVSTSDAATIRKRPGGGCQKWFSHPPRPPEPPGLLVKNGDHVAVWSMPVKQGLCAVERAPRN
jgi:hypothetical protein